MGWSQNCGFPCAGAYQKGGGEIMTMTVLPKKKTEDENISLLAGLVLSRFSVVS